MGLENGARWSSNDDGRGNYIRRGMSQQRWWQSWINLRRYNEPQTCHLEEVEMKRVASALLVALTLTIPVAVSKAQTTQSACLHGQDESPAQQARRRQALTTARRINTYENVAFQRMGMYVAVDALAPYGGKPTIPGGFALTFANDNAGYVFAVKDSTDPCQFAYFSDRSGLIYMGEAIR
jgi:hypothetical protein